jgi:MFS family permease
VTPDLRLAGRRARPAALAWALWGVALLAVAATAWFDQVLRGAGRPDLVQLDASGLTGVLTVLSAATAGALLATWRPRHPVGWLLLGFGLLQALASAAEGYARVGLLARPGSLPAAGAIAMLSSVSFIPGLGIVGFILLLTPTGSLPSPRWRWWAWLAAVVPIAFTVSWLLGSATIDPDSALRALPNPLVIPALSKPLQDVYAQAAPATTITLVVAAVSLLLRFRRARGIERLRLRWLTLAAALAPLAVVVTAAGIITGSDVLANWAAGLYLALLPLTICASIVRYRLYDLDRIISRTLAYSLLTVLLALGYAAVALGLGQLFGQESSLAVAIATLAVAAAFQPARRRVQRAMDRRFDRRRYDAARTIAAFSARLRQQTDLDTLADELLAVVDDTMQPTRASLWLRSPSPAGAPADRR